MSIDIPNSVTSIGNTAFEGCSSLTSIIIPGSVTEIPESAFRGCSGLTSIIIPSSVTKIGTSAFSGCQHVENFYCYAESLPTAAYSLLWEEEYNNVTLHVPATSIDAYKATVPWKFFGKIVALTDEETAINLPQAEENWTENEVQQIYTLDGRPSRTLQKGVNIIRTNNGKTKKVLVK